MKKAFAALGATLLGVTGAAASGAGTAHAATTTLPACTNANQLTFNFDDTTNNFYGTCTPQYGLGKAEFTITNTAGFPAGTKDLDDPAVTATPSTDVGAVDAYFDSTSTNGFTSLSQTSSTATTQTYSGSLAYKLASVTPVPVTSLPAGCTPTSGITYDHAFEVSYLPDTITFTQTVNGKPQTFTITSAPAPLFLGYQNQDVQSTQQLCASNGTDTLEGDNGSIDNLTAFFGVFTDDQIGNGASTLTPFPNENLTGQLGTFYPAPDAPTITKTVPGVNSATITLTPAASTGATVTGYQYSLDGGETWHTLPTPTTGSTLTGTITGLTGGTTYPVTVRAVSTSGNSPASNSITVTPTDPAPTAAALSPGHGPAAGGTLVTVTGTGFIPGRTSVTIGGITVPATSVTVTSATSLQFTSPEHESGTVAVTATSPGGTTSPLPFTYDTPITAVAATGTTPTELAYTGTNTTPETVAAGLALLTGTGLLLVSRRRRRHS